MFFSYYKYKSNLEQYQIALSIKLSKVGGCKNITLLKILKNENCPLTNDTVKAHENIANLQKEQKLRPAITKIF